MSRILFGSSIFRDVAIEGHIRQSSVVSISGGRLPHELRVLESPRMRLIVSQGETIVLHFGQLRRYNHIFIFYQ